MDRRRASLQVELIRVTYRSELARLEGALLADFRLRAVGILEGLAAEVADDAELLQRVREVRDEIG